MPLFVEAGKSVTSSASPDAMMGILVETVDFVGVGIVATDVDILIGRIVLDELVGQEAVDASVAAQSDIASAVLYHAAGLGNGVLSHEESATQVR